MEEKRYIKRKDKALNDGNREQIAISCKHLGDFYNQHGKYNEAVKEYQQEVELYMKMGKHLETAKAERMIGEMFMLLCEFDKAKEHINVYLKLVKKLQNKVEEQRAYATLGRAHLLHGQSTSEISVTTSTEQLKFAEKAFLRSLLLIKELSGQITKLEQLDMQARCYLNIGVIKEHMGEFEESVSYIEKAIKICKTHELYELAHLCYISMSLLYNYKKIDSTSALRYCNLALDVAKRLPNKVKKICETLMTKSEILIRVGDFASVKQILTKAYKKNTPDENDRSNIEKSLRIVVKICQTLDELVTTSSLDYDKRKSLFEKLGDGCCYLQNYDKAIEYYKQMLECAVKNLESGKTLIPIYVSLYQTYRDNKQYDKALEYLWMEFDLNKDEPTEAFTTLCGIAEVCELEKQSFWTIQDVYQKARAQAVKAEKDQLKLERIAMIRLKKLQLKHNMQTLAEELDQEARNKGITLDINEDDDSDSDNEAECVGNEQNTPEWADDVCLDDLTDSDTSDLDETDKPRPHRVTRGTRTISIKRNNKGETQLHQACIAGNLELARRLIEQGHAVNIRDHAGWLPLHEACNHGFRNIVELLLDKGATAAINDKGGTKCDGITPLYDACSNGFIDVVELLLERGADATVKTDYGETCVSGLDKWRISAKLNESEQAQYAQMREKLVQQLSKVGFCNASVAAPLTNANVEHALSSDDAERQNSTDEDELNLRPRRQSSLNRSRDSIKTSKIAARQQNACKEYKSVMAQLKHPNRGTNLNDDDYDLPSTSKQKRNAYLDDDEFDADNWLIDDVKPEKKKRRYYFTPTKESHSPGSYPTISLTDHSTSKENFQDSVYSSWELDALAATETDAYQALLDAATGTTSQQRQKQVRKLSLSRSSSNNSNVSNPLPSSRNRKPKSQSSLFDSGFLRLRSESPNAGEESADSTSVFNLRSVEPDSTTTGIQLVTSPLKSSPIQVQAAPGYSPIVSFKVKIQDELLLVPIERKKLQDINMRWLATESARRYYNVNGLRPVLRLKTSDGFAYEEGDPVSVALEQNLILATVVEWKIPPLGQRYEETCQQLDKEINCDIKSVLERAQTSNAIELADFWLTPKQSEPIMKALMHQTRLRVLDLSNNFLQNEGCQQLAKSLTTLEQLKSLKLTGNYIKCFGLDALLSSAGTDKLVHLEELDLSQNPLGDGCLGILEQYCSTAAGRALRTVFLSQCKINSVNDSAMYGQFNTFDISFNQLSEQSMRVLTAELNACSLQYLNLSYTRSTVQLMDEHKCLENADLIVSLFENGTCEQFRYIELCGCGLSDVHVFKIVQCLGRAKALQTLDISDNTKLSAIALQSIIDEVPHLCKLIASNCEQLLDDERLDRLQQLGQLPNFLSLTISNEPAAAMERQVETLQTLWQKCWGEKAKSIRFDGNLTLYTNEDDLRKS